ncbi:winged helix-turn-helix domain-containing protein [Kytococcus schroeteri]|uniref:winged helix-turn-helix domain-containing protein n=1 Tax=Kytococcus schroeteri TaxID=138300 RepID=UPI0015E88EBE|nr:winged helix-turn-helix domain-containing protein [Kytococcus schroeteri]
MKTPPSALTPFVRSDAVGALLAETLGHPDREFSLAELGRRTGVAGPVVHREVGRLVEAGVLRDRREGRNRLVSADPDHPLFAPMREVVAATYGPVPVLRQLLEGVDGVQEAVVHGSWAARRAGEQGAFPRDVDVVVVGDVPRRTLAELATRAEAQLDREVTISRVAVEDWEADEPTGFVATVRSRPMVDLLTGEVRV